VHREGTMKQSIRLVWVIISLSVFVFALAHKEYQWKGKIEYEDGVKVVKNPKEPLFGDITFELEEDLSIGNEEDENYAFYNFARVTADSDGNIYVLDGENCRIQKFDKNGIYLQSIGRKGQGPGEFERPWGICFDSQRNIYVREMREIDIFDANGKYKRTIVSHESFGPYFGITIDGTIIAHIQSFRAGEMSEEVVLFDGEGKKIKTIVEFKSKTPSFGRVIDLGSYYTPGLWFYPINEEFAVYGYSSEYELFVIDSSGELVHIIEKNESPTPLSKKEINMVIDDFIERQKERSTGPKFSKSELKKASKFPKHMAFFLGFNTDDKSRIYVMKFKSRLDDYKGGYYDIFSKDGYYLYRAKISPLPHVIKNGCVYITERDEESGYLKIKRYKIKNWEQIREGL
jgi:hypothetical protein